jgi:hypothetical protein
MSNVHHGSAQLHGELERCWDVKRLADIADCRRVCPSPSCGIVDFRPRHFQNAVAQFLLPGKKAFCDPCGPSDRSLKRRIKALREAVHRRDYSSRIVDDHLQAHLQFASKHFPIVEVAQVIERIETPSIEEAMSLSASSDPSAPLPLRRRVEGLATCNWCSSFNDEEGERLKSAMSGLSLPTPDGISFTLHEQSGP